MFALIPQSKLIGRFTYAQNPPLWAGFKSLESSLSRKGSCVSQYRTPDAPEMRQCQTKSFLGNLVCFKTCNHILRNSLKEKTKETHNPKRSLDRSWIWRPFFALDQSERHNSDGGEKKGESRAIRALSCEGAAVEPGRAFRLKAHATCQSARARARILSSPRQSLGSTL
jgi:hypothetical protein